MSSPTTIAAYLDAIRKAGDVDIRPCSLVSDQFKPIPPHKVGITHLLGRSQFLLADATGLGKTPQAVVAWAYAREKDPRTRLLALVSKSSYFQFAAEVERFVPSAHVEVLGWHRHGKTRRQLSPDERQSQYARFAANVTGCLVATYHTIALDFRIRDAVVGDRWAFPETWQPNIVLFDECHILRTDKQTLIYPMAKALAAQARAVWGLSATPLSTRLTDLYYLYKILRPGLLGSRQDFDEAYLQRELKTIYVKGGKRKVWNVTGTKNLDKLAAIIKPYYLKRPPEVIGPYMPDIVVQPKQVEMSPAQTALYRKVCAQVFPWVKTAESLTAERRRELERAALDDPDSDVVRLDGIKIATPAVAMAYAQMALDCPEVLGQPKVPSAKYDQLLDWLENDLAGEKVLVYTRYRQVAEVYHRTLRKAGLDVGLISGKLSSTQREQVRVAFQDTPSPRVLILTSAGKESLNLQAARVIVFLDLPWSWSEFIQVVGRARRYGSAHRSVSLLLLGASPDTASGATSLDDTTLQTLQARAILVQGTFGLTLAEAELTTVSFADDLFQQALAGA
jgi:SNF2 family DNA or RNA helicase